MKQNSMKKQKRSFDSCTAQQIYGLFWGQEVSVLNLYIN